MRHCGCRCNCMNDEIIIESCYAKSWCEKNAWWWLDDLCDIWRLRRGHPERNKNLSVRIRGDRYQCMRDHGVRRKEAGIPLKIWYP